MTPRTIRLAALGLILFALLAGPLPAGSSASHTPGAPTHGVPPVAFHPPPVWRGSAPAGSEYWYTQVGATLAQVNGTTLNGQLTTLVEEVTIVASSYPIGYELNGISTTGDWYQVLVGDNWGGCDSGYEMIYEVWNNTGYGESPVCDPAITLNKGDSIKLSLSFPSASMACLDAEDLTTTFQEHDCVSQPDSGANGFELVAGASNANGYLTGPMTEIANSVPTSCPDYTNMPAVEYRWPAAYHVTGYYPFSDEFEVLSGSVVSLCYSSTESELALSAGDPTSHVVDTASGTSYGPHYVSGQNLSYLLPTYGWQLVTDPVPLTDVMVTPLSGTFTLGTVIELNSTVTGGTSPYSTLWAVNRTFVGELGLHFNWTASASGTYTIAAYGVDAEDLVNGPADSTITVPGALSAGPISTDTPSDAADVAQSIALFSRVVGGLPPYQFVWSGLPPGCTAGDLATLACVPSQIGTFDVALRVIDTNGTQVDAPGLALTVSPAFTTSAATSRTSLDVGQSFWVNVTSSGGAAPDRYIWGDVPAGCPLPSGPSALCDPFEPGRVGFIVTVTDHNGVEFNLTPPSVNVAGDPQVQLSSDRSTADAGIPIVLSAQVLGGQAPFQYNWAGLAAGCVPATVGSSATCAFPAGADQVWLSVTDANGVTVAAAPVTLGIFPTLTATVTGGGNLTLGDTLGLNVTPSGGSGSVGYTWQNLPSGCSPPSGGDLACVPTTEGEYNITVVLSDGGGGRVTLVAQVNVTAPIGSTSSSSVAPVVLLVVGIAVAAAVIAAIAVVVRRRRA
jgi:hypothetical protein